MKQKIPFNWFAILKSILILGTLIVGLKNSQSSIAQSQARMQTAAQTCPHVPMATDLCVDLVQPLRQLIMTTTASSLPLGFTTDITDLRPLVFGSGEYNLPEMPDLTDQQRQATQLEIDRNVQRLDLNRSANLAPFSTSLAWPIQAANGLSDYGYHAIGAFVDHNLAKPNQLQDYACGIRTYDTSTFNHTGTDISLWPFSWNKMDNNEVEVIAAASGTIVAKYDGNFDRSCNMNLNQWNGVVIQHADGSTAWYVHMKKNSVTSKIVGNTVITGEYLGVVGSSGSSSGPHLHFEIHDAGNTVIDPYVGACNNISTWWIAQRPYDDSAVNFLTTGNAAPEFLACPSQTITHVKDQFTPGDTAYFAIYYRDIRPSLQSVIKVYKPDGSAYRSWTYNSSANYSASYWYGYANFTANVPLGLWKFEVSFNGQIYTHYFSVGDPLSLHSRPADQSIYLNWDVISGLPVINTWQLTYLGLTGTQVSPITGLISSTRAYTLTGLTNYTWYTITLDAMANTNSIMTNMVRVMPSDLLLYLPLVLK